MPRLVFLDTVDVEDFEDLADDSGWTEVELDPDSYNSVDYPSQLWDVPGGQVRFVDDTVYGLQFVDIDPASAEVDRAIRGAFEARDRDELFGLLDLTAPPPDVKRTLYRLARSARLTPFSEPIFAAVMNALDSDDEGVLVAALAVTAGSFWTRFLPRVTELYESTGDATVRSFAGNAQYILRSAERLGEVDLPPEYEI